MRHVIALSLKGETACGKIGIELSECTPAIRSFSIFPGGDAGVSIDEMFGLKPVKAGPERSPPAGRLGKQQYFQRSKAFADQT
jgi:hypothetical protein